MRMFSTDSNSVTRRAQGPAEVASRRVLWVPLLVGGLVTAVLASRRASVRSWFERTFPSRSNETAPRQTNDSALARLRDAILGNNKTAVASVFGAPPATAGGFITGHYHQADTWYYPLDKVEKSAMVIHFENGIAREAQFILAPRFG
jgi:hypothetical protein